MRGLCSRVERLARIVGNWVRGNLARQNARTQHGEPIPETTGGAPRDGACHDGVVRGLAGEGLAVTCIGIRFGAGDEAGAELRGTRAQA